MRINSAHYLTQFSKNAGFSLLEVLVTILILSFGLLGMAALITTGMRSNNIAHYRSVATQQTLNITDRMRANLAGVRTGSYDSLDNSIPADPDCVANDCSEAEMAVYDHFQWNTNNARLLPGGAGTVTGNLANGFRVVLMWTEKEMGGNVDTNPDAGCPGTANVRCFVTRFSP